MFFNVTNQYFINYCILKFSLYVNFEYKNNWKIVVFDFSLHRIK